MAQRKKAEEKAVVPQRENKAVRPAASNKTAPGYARVRVIKDHDGLCVGEILSRPEKVAKELINLGYWERV